MYIICFLVILFIFVGLPTIFIKRLLRKEREQKLEDAKELMRYQYELEHQNEKK